MRSLGRNLGVSHASVQRIWRARGLKPHLSQTFKLATDFAAAMWRPWAGRR